MRRYLIMFGALVCMATLWADNVRFAVDGPRQVIQGQQFQLEYTLYNASGKDLRLPEFSGCKVLYQGTSSGTSVSVVNGNVDRQTTETHVITLRAEKEGSYTFAPATISADGRTFSTNTWKLTILPPDKTSSSAGGASRQSMGEEAGNTELFIRTVLSKTKVYEQEALLATIKLYTRASGVQAENYSFPSFEGFVVQDIDLPQNTSFELENYNGVNYKMAILKQCLLFPQRTGKITINPGKFEFQVETYQLVNGPFGPMRVPQGVSRSVSSNAASVEVMPLPAGKPVSFMGGVGNFTLSSSISSTHVKANEAITLKLIFKGSGNLKYMKNPDVKFPVDFDVYDPKISTDLKNTDAGVSGIRTVEYTIIPRRAGEFTIPSVEFSYFDFSTNRYKTLATPEYHLTVEQGNTSEGSVVLANFSDQEAVKHLNQDIRYIKTGDLHQKKSESFFYGSWTYRLCYLVPLLLLVAFVLFNYRKARENANASRLKTKKANKVAIRRLKIAGKYLREHNSERFYDETLKAVWGYISDKLLLPLSELTRDNVAAQLMAYGADEELIGRVIQVIDTCEFARYAPAQSNEAMDRLYDETLDVIGKMENVKR